MIRVPVIHLWNPSNSEINCCICGKEDFNRWGIPIDMETAMVASNDFAGDWAGKPACESCYQLHAAGAFVGTYPSY